ncbi:MAG: DUF4346 domain-containing protein [Candidatus Woesearchaeota archaeon]
MPVQYSEKFREVDASYDESKEFELDPKGYFLIRVNQEAKKIEVGFCEKGNVIEIKISGDNPQEIYQTAIKHELITRLDHAAYLGSELQKAFIAMKKNIEYVQDDELDI